MELDIIKEKIAIVVGSDDLPAKVINEAIAKNLDFIVVGIKGSSPKKLVNSYNNFWFYMGEIADFLTKLKKNNVKKILFVGAVSRPSLLSLKLDYLGKKFVKEYFSQISGDDSLLSMIIKEIERYGFEVIGVQDIAQNILADKKVYTKIIPTKEQLIEITEAFSLAKKLSVFDIGQSLIFQQNMIIAVEGVEGTAKMILRSKKLIKRESFLFKVIKKFMAIKNSKESLKEEYKFKREELLKKDTQEDLELNSKDKSSNIDNSKIGGAFLLKIKKAHQEIRIDLPTIGDKTVLQAHKAGLVGIVIEADSTIILNEQKTIDLANKYGIFIIAM